MVIGVKNSYDLTKYHGFFMDLCIFPIVCILSGGRREGTTVLNIFNDQDYNRSVITIVASIDCISESLSFLLGEKQQLR